MSELSKRVVTALLGVAAILALIVWGGLLGITLIVMVISMGMVHEFSGITLDLPDRRQKQAVMVGLAFLIGLLNLVFLRSEYELLITCFLGLFTFYLVTAPRHPEAPAFTDHFRELMHSLFGLVYLVFVPLFLIRIHQGQDGLHWTLIFLFIVWASDIGAYFAGRSFGRRKLYPLISPKKTIEGALGGCLSSILVTVLYKVTLYPELKWSGAILIPVFVGSFAQVGDLCESFLKRAFGRKDSGSILPGHGGFLDRFDGVVFSLPVMYACIRAWL